MTVTTVGYGDISPSTTTEQVVAIIMMLSGAVLLSFLIGTVSSILNEGSPEKQRSDLFRAKAQQLGRCVWVGQAGFWVNGWVRQGFD